MKPAFNFNELYAVPRGAMFDTEVNRIAREAAAKIKKPSTKSAALDTIDKAELNKWYGKLECDNVMMTFRRGVCHFMSIAIKEGEAVFHLNVINENVQFGGKNG